MSGDNQQDPETARLRCGSAPIPRTAIVSRRAGVVKTTLRRAKNRRGLDNPRPPAKPTQTGKGEWELVARRRLALANVAGLPLVGARAHAWSGGFKNTFIEIFS